LQCYTDNRKQSCYVAILVYIRLGSKTEKPKVMDKMESSEEEEDEELTEEEKGSAAVDYML